MVFCLLAAAAQAQEAPAAKSYPDGRGGEVVLPLGDLSFADEVVSFKRGTPSAVDAHSVREEALGPCAHPPQVLELFAEDDSRNVYAGEREVRPPGAPTTAETATVTRVPKTCRTGRQDYWDFGDSRSAHSRVP
jgi:hypothetical protein